MTKPFTLHCPPTTAAILRSWAQDNGTPLSAVVAAGFVMYIEEFRTSDLPLPTGRRVSIHVDLNSGLARRVRARLTDTHRTMAWLLHQIASVPRKPRPSGIDKEARTFTLTSLQDILDGNEE